MADGSVRSFIDNNRDGALDNGLAAMAQGDDPNLLDLELPEQEVFSGAALRGL